MEGYRKTGNSTCRLSKSVSKNQLLDTKLDQKNFNVTKKIIRNVDAKKPNIGVQKAIKSLGYPKHSSGHPSKIINEHPSYVDKSVKAIKSDLTQPGLCTALQIADEIIKTVATERKQDDNKINFDVANQLQVPNKKVLKKINIPFTQQIYKDLINLEISNEDLHVGKNVLPIKTKQFVKNKDKMPILSEYYQPYFSKKYKIEKQEPHFVIDKIKYYNGYRVTDKVKTFEVLQ